MKVASWSNTRKAENFTNPISPRGLTDVMMDRDFSPCRRTWNQSSSSTRWNYARSTECHPFLTAPNISNNKTTMTEDITTVSIMSLLQRARDSGTCPPSLLSEEGVVKEDGFDDAAIQLMDSAGTIPCCLISGFSLRVVDLTVVCFRNLSLPSGG
jgi:hypothetical protein